MESEFEPDVRTEKLPETLIVIVNLPGFRREDLRVQLNNRGSLVISGERGVQEMDEMTKVGGRLMEKMQRGGNRFRKVISVPENLNVDGISAKFGDERLRVSLPLLHISDVQQNQEALPGGGKPDQSLQSKVDRSNPAGKQESMKEQPQQDDQSAKHPEAIRQDADKEKPTVAAEEQDELLEEKKAEAPMQAEDLVGEPPISTKAQAVSEEAGSAHRSESMQSETKKDMLYRARSMKVLDEDQEGQSEDESSSPSPTDRFPYQKGIHLPASLSSTFSKRGVMIASTVLVLSVGLYITYRSRLRHRI